MPNYYIDGPTLSTSTAAYTDSALTNCAASGYYSDGEVVRYLQNSGGVCQFLTETDCPTCVEPCGNNINANGNQGIYLLDINAGGDTGAIVIQFDPASVPDGIRATYDGTVYNKLSSPVSGVLQSTTTGNFTVIGAQGSDCGLTGGAAWGPLNEFNYVNGSFQGTGNTQSGNFAAGDVQLTVTAPGNCVMVIPKPNPTPSEVEIEMIGPCGGTVFTVNAACPVQLTAVDCSTRQASSTGICGVAMDSILYFVHVTTPGEPSMHDFVFTDLNGANEAVDGWYRATTSTGSIGIEVSNGVIINTQNCT